jgi:hypothetical protein
VSAERHGQLRCPGRPQAEPPRDSSRAHRQERPDRERAPDCETVCRTDSEFHRGHSIQAHVYRPGQVAEYPSTEVNGLNKPSPAGFLRPGDLLWNLCPSRPPRTTARRGEKLKTLPPAAARAVVTCLPAALTGEPGWARSFQQGLIAEPPPVLWFVRSAAHITTTVVTVELLSPGAGVN